GFVGHLEGRRSIGPTGLIPESELRRLQVLRGQIPFFLHQRGGPIPRWPQRFSPIPAPASPPWHTRVSTRKCGPDSERSRAFPPDRAFSRGDEPPKGESSHQHLGV